MKKYVRMISVMISKQFNASIPEGQLLELLKVSRALPIFKSWIEGGF